MSVKDKVIVIMGASSGIGEATAQRLAKDGDKLVIAARREERLQALVKSLPGAEMAYAVVDVTQRDEVQAALDLAVDRYGRVDALFNNAGIMPTAPLAETRVDEWQRMLDINVMGMLHGIAAALPIMQRQQDGHILATDSLAGQVVYPGSAVYCGTKFAVRAIMEGLRQEEHDHNIRSTIISPGLVDTELYTTINEPENRERVRSSAQIEGLGLRPRDVAEAVAYAIGAPETVAINDIVIRPTRQVR